MTGFAMQNSTICLFSQMHFFVPFNFEGITFLPVFQLLAKVQNNPT